MIYSTVKKKQLVRLFQSIININNCEIFRKKKLSNFRNNLYIAVDKMENTLV